MKAVVFHGVGDIRVDDVPEPQLQAPTDAIVRITASAMGWIKVELKPAVAMATAA